jgi:hypothetical protein
MNAPLRNPTAILKQRPFDGRLRVLDVDWERRPSIAEILAAQADLPQNFREQCVARVVDDFVPRAAETITAKIIHRWPDEIGRPLAS